MIEQEYNKEFTQPHCYVVSVQNNPLLKTKDEIVNMDSIIVQNEIVEYVVTRCAIFFKKTTKRVSRNVKAMKVSDLNIGDIIYVLEPDYPDRCVNDKGELELL